MTTQQILTAALEVSVIVSVVYIGFALACFISRINTCTPAPAKPKPVAIAVVPAQVESQPVESPLKSLKVPQLQKLARDRGLPTRATDSDRRLNKGELLALLT